jgi:hypothetical protein
MEEGCLVIMHGLEPLYQSFYDLFNQSFVEMGQNKYCRIAIGSDSVRAKVKEGFKVVIVVLEQEMHGGQKYDPPLLNRFEKQILDFKDFFDQKELQVKKNLQDLVH